MNRPSILNAFNEFVCFVDCDLQTGGKMIDVPTPFARLPSLDGLSHQKEGRCHDGGWPGCVCGWSEKATSTWIVAIGPAEINNGQCDHGTSGGPDALKMHAITMVNILKF